MRFPATTRRDPKRTGRSPRPALLRRTQFSPYVVYTPPRMSVPSLQSPGSPESTCGVGLPSWALHSGFKVLPQHRPSAP
jgi:hypothetical protein